MARSRGLLEGVLVFFCIVFLVTTLSSIAASADKRAAYFTTNNSSGAGIVAIEISAEDGLLKGLPVITATGGNGGEGTGGAGAGVLGQVFEPDSLFSQDSVVVSGNYLFVVNPGSSTLSLFHINSSDPTHPTLIGEPANTLGDFPTALAYSAKLRTVCVANAGVVDGVSCFSVDKHVGLTALDKKPRPIKNYTQTTPVVGPIGTVSDILFNPSSTALFLVVKSENALAGVPGLFHAWPVKKGIVSRKRVVSSIPSSVIPFGATFLGSDSRLLVSELATGFAILDVSPKLKLTLEVDTTITLPAGLTGPAFCWTAYSPAFQQMYIMDAGNPLLTVADPKSGAILNTITIDASEAGSLDTRFDRKWLYILAADPSIAVIDVSTQKQVQNYDLSSVGSRGPWVGMATFPSTYV